MLYSQNFLNRGVVLSELYLDVDRAPSLHSDSLATIEWSTDECFESGRAKRIEIDLHFVLEVVTIFTIDVKYVPIDSVYVVAQTKSLNPVYAKNIMKNIGPSPQLERER